MNPAEALLFALIFLAPGGFWLGYTFLKQDAQVKLAMYGKRGEAADGDDEVAKLRKEVAELRKQLEELRESSASYDLSLEEHLARLEQKISSDQTLRDRIQG